MEVTSIPLVHSCGIRHSWIPGRNFPWLAPCFFCVPALHLEVRESSPTLNLDSASLFFSMHSVPRHCDATALKAFYSCYFAYFWQVVEFLMKVKMRVCFVWHCEHVGLFHSTLRSVLNPLCNTKADCNVQQTLEYREE